MFTWAGQSMSLCCDIVRGEGVWEGAMVLPPLSATFQTLPPLPISKVGPSGADSCVGRFAYVLGPCGSLQGTLLWGWEFLPLPPQPPRGFQSVVWGFISPALEPWGCVVCFPLCSSWFISAWMWDHPVRNLLPRFALFSTNVLSPLCPAVGLRPSYQSDECVFFSSLIVRLPYSSIFCQFWLFFCF